MVNTKGDRASANLVTYVYHNRLDASPTASDNSEYLTPVYDPSSRPNPYPPNENNKHPPSKENKKAGKREEPDKEQFVRYLLTNCREPLPNSFSKSASHINVCQTCYPPVVHSKGSSNTSSRSGGIHTTGVHTCTRQEKLLLEYPAKVRLRSNSEGSQFRGSDELYHRLMRSNVPRIASYRPLTKTDQGVKQYQKVAVTPDQAIIKNSLHDLPNTSIISSLDLSHRYLKPSESTQLDLTSAVGPLSSGCQVVNSDPIMEHQEPFAKSTNLLRNVKVINDPNTQNTNGYVKKHRRITSAISINSQTQRRAQTLGFKSLKKDLRPFGGFEDDFFQHSMDMHHFSYSAPAKNIFLRYCPTSLQAQYVSMRTFGRTNSPQTPLYGSRSRELVNENYGIRGRCILKDVSFRARSGEISVILGGSGSGKTTLLDAFAGRLDNRGHQTGKILIDGLRCTTSTVKRKLAYVIQHDRLLPNLTVQETLSFVARLTYPDYCFKELEAKVVEVLDELGLMHVKTSKVGDGLVRGISGGERRRLSIACQLIKFTHILLLDEPTTGLDSFNAYNLIETLSRLSRKNIVVIVTIHQPRSELFPFFDAVTLMSQGNIVYHGARSDLIPYFTDIGYPCPEFQNPLDHYIDVVSVDRYTKLNQDITETKLKSLLQRYRRSNMYTNLMAELGSREYGDAEWKDTSSPCQVVYKLLLLVYRMNINVVRSIRAFGMRSTVGLMFALMLFAFILRLKDDQAGMQNRIGLLFQIVNGPTYFGIMNAVDLFPTLRDLFYRESLDGLYQPWLFIMAYFLHVVPFTAVTTLLFGGLGYWGIGFYPDALRCVYFTAVFFILMIQGEAITVMILGLIADPVIANGAVSLIMSLSITVGSGFIRNFQTLHPIFELLSYGSMHRYASACLAVNEFQDLNLTCSADEYCTYTNGEEYLYLTFPEAIDEKNLNFSILASYLTLLLVLCHGLFSLIRIPRLR